MSGRVRIIGGHWKGRLLPVTDRPGLRPSGDRSRETLFNWLSRDVPGAVCLDAFAGTGVLGLEAASRGARQVVMVERDRRALEGLRGSLERLASDPVEGDIELVSGDVLAWMGGCARRFDIVFIDPPFGSGLAGRALDCLLEADMLADGGRVYLETGRREADPLAGREATWQVDRDKTMGEVRMRLVSPAEP